MPLELTLFANETVPEVEKVPLVTESAFPDSSVKVPELVIAKLPTEVKPFCTSNVVPRKVAEPTVTGLTKVVAPVAAFVCAKAPEILTMPLKVVAAALVRVTAANPVLSALVPEPYTLPNPNAPVPEFNVTASAAPPVVPAKLPITLMLPFVDVRLIVVASAVVNPPPMLMDLPLLWVVMLFAKFTWPLVEKWPTVTEIGLADVKVKTPELVTAKSPAVVVKPFCTEQLVPFKAAEPTLTLLANVVTPVAAFVCVNAPVILTMPLKLAAPECVMVTAVNPFASADVPEP